MKIGYLGPKGTFTYFALTLAYGDTIELVEKLSLDRLFDSLISKEVDAMLSTIKSFSLKPGSLSASELSLLPE